VSADIEAIRQRWTKNGLDMTFPFSLDTAARDIHTLLAALDAAAAERDAEAKANGHALDALGKAFIERDTLKARVEEFRRDFPAVAAQRNESQARVKELETAVVAHRQGVYRGREPKCRYNLALYGLLGETKEAQE